MKQRGLCRHDDEAIILYHYGELDATASAEVEARLQTCSGCRAVLDDLRALAAVVPATPSVEPDQTTLNVLRRAVRARLNPVRRETVTWWRPAPMALRIAIGVALVAVGFLWGGTRGTGNTEALNNLLYASRPVETPGGSINPYLAGVASVAFDAETGTVGIRFNTYNDVFVRGRPTDPAIRQLLQQALLDEDHPAARLDAVRVVGQSHSQPDPELTDALEGLLRDEPVDGIRIRAVQALRALYRGRAFSPAVRKTLLEIMAKDQSTALRVEAMQALTENALDNRVEGGSPELHEFTIDLARNLRAIQNDANGIVRVRASSLIRELEQPGPLEQIPSGN